MTQSWMDPPPCTLTAGNCGVCGSNTPCGQPGCPLGNFGERDDVTGDGDDC